MNPRPGADEPVRPGAAALLLTVDGRYLMRQRDRAPQNRFPDWWCCFDGGIEPGETVRRSDTTDRAPCSRPEALLRCDERTHPPTQEGGPDA
jgi:8-oxo-dGTP pyrophosphatase MutT (NUDIX family)